MENDQRYKIPQQVRKDLGWWDRYLDTYNGCSMLWLKQNGRMDQVFATDACLTGIGGWCKGSYFHCKIPEDMKNKETIHIGHYEMMALMVGLKLWYGRIRGEKFAVGCDNMIVVSILNHGWTRDELMQNMLREITYILATNQAEMIVQYVKTSDNVIPDLLSRWEQDVKCRKQFEDLRQDT